MQQLLFFFLLHSQNNAKLNTRCFDKNCLPLITVRKRSLGQGADPPGCRPPGCRPRSRMQTAPRCRPPRQSPLSKLPHGYKSPLGRPPPPRISQQAGGYASYWNAYLFLHKFATLCWSRFSSTPLESRIQLGALIPLQGVELWYTISITRKGGGSADYCHNQLRNKLIAVAITLGVILVLLYIAMIVLYFSKWKRLVPLCFTW